MEKRKVKTIVALLLVLIMAVAMIGCAGNSNGTDSNSDTRISSQSGDTKKIAEEIQSKTDAERSEAGADTPPTEWRIARVRRCGLAAGSFIVYSDVLLSLSSLISCFKIICNISPFS